MITNCPRCGERAFTAQWDPEVPQVMACAICGNRDYGPMEKPRNYRRRLATRWEAEYKHTRR